MATGECGSTGLRDHGTRLDVGRAFTDDSYLLACSMTPNGMRTADYRAAVADPPGADGGLRGTLPEGLGNGGTVRIPIWWDLFQPDGTRTRRFRRLALVQMAHPV
jgi:hypothetical protein